MEHLTPEQLHLFLAGELEPDQSLQVEAHLTRCSRCESLLAAIAADDAALAEALELSPEETAWVEAQDLRPAMARRLTPWFLLPQGLILLLTMLTAAGWALERTTSLLLRAVTPTGPVSFALGVLEGLGRLAWEFLNYVGSVGPLAALAPLLLILLCTVLVRRRSDSHA